MEEKLFSYCSECGVQVELTEAGSYSKRRPADGSVAPLDPTDVPWIAEEFVLCNCPKCQSPFLFKREWYEIPAEFETVTSEPELLYPKAGRLPQSLLPRQVAKPYQDAVRSYEVGLNEPCVIMCRKCLEAVCHLQGVTKGNLKTRLEGLRDAGVIDSKLYTWTDGLRLVANDAAHDIDISLSNQDARDAIDFVEAILSYVFLLAKKFKEFEARRKST